MTTIASLMDPKAVGFLIMWGVLAILAAVAYVKEVWELNRARNPRNIGSGLFRNGWRFLCA